MHFSLKEFLPQHYMRVNKIERKIFGEHKKLQGTSEVDTKVMYVKLARGLPTFGVHFFLVKVSPFVLSWTIENNNTRIWELNRNTDILMNPVYIRVKITCRIKVSFKFTTLVYEKWIFHNCCSCEKLLWLYTFTTCYLDNYKYAN